MQSGEEINGIETAEDTEVFNKRIQQM